MNRKLSEDELIALIRYYTGLITESSNHYIAPSVYFIEPKEAALRLINSTETIAEMGKALYAVARAKAEESTS